MEFYELLGFENVIHDIDLNVDDKKMLNDFDLKISKRKISIRSKTKIYVD
jgi:hypothetical protein